MDAVTAVVLSSLGLIAGLVGGMLGIGGGLLMVPGMVLLLGIPQHIAQGTSLAVIAVTSLVGAYTHYRQGTVSPRLVAIIAPIALVFGVLGAYVATLIPARPLQVLFSVVLFVMGVRMVLGK
jgi:uncharacterized membrane protein YfcA